MQNSVVQSRHFKTAAVDNFESISLASDKSPAK